MVPFWMEEILARLESNDSDLCHLNLNIRRLDGKMLDVLARRGIQQNTVLHTLNLTGSLKGVSLDTLSHVLSYNSSLQVLHLSYNNVSDVVPLASLLETNDGLVELYLDYNRIDSKGGIGLANALRSNTHLKLLQLNSNQLQDDGAQALSHVLEKDNATLVQLYMSQNQITSRAGRALLDCLQTNVTLTHLDLQKNQVHAELLREIEFMVQTNRSGRHLLRRPDILLGLWSYVLGRISQRQPDMLYYFLTAKPGLVCRG